MPRPREGRRLVDRGVLRRSRSPSWGCGSRGGGSRGGAGTRRGRRAARGEGAPGQPVGAAVLALGRGRNRRIAGRGGHAARTRRLTRRELAEARDARSIAVLGDERERTLGLLACVGMPAERGVILGQLLVEVDVSQRDALL